MDIDLGRTLSDGQKLENPGIFSLQILLIPCIDHTWTIHAYRIWRAFLRSFFKENSHSRICFIHWNKRNSQFHFWLSISYQESGDLKTNIGWIFVDLEKIGSDKITGGNQFMSDRGGNKLDNIRYPTPIISPAWLELIAMLKSKFTFFDLGILKNDKLNIVIFLIEMLKITCLVIEYQTTSKWIFSCR